MDIQQTIAPAAAKLQVADKTDKSDKTTDALNERVPVSSFSKLLQGAQGIGEVRAPSLSIDKLAAMAEVDVSVLPLAEGAFIPGLELLQGAWSVDSLVGQTQRLDIANPDAALQDGSFLLAKQEAGLDVANLSAVLYEDGVLLINQGGAVNSLTWGAQPNVALGQSVATVAAGVQSAVSTPVASETQTVVVAASALLAEAADMAEAVAQTVSDGLKTDQASDGRVTLHGAWKLEDPQATANPALHRVMGQVEQWAAASAGMQPKVTERAEGKSAATAAEWLSAGHGSGTRLTENAVQEAQQTQDAAFETPDAPVEDMRFWLQGKQQRAEVVLDKDGQPVRVQVSVRGNEAHVTFRADQAQTRELLDASVAQLREMLEEQGVQLAGVSVQADERGGQQPSQQGQTSPWEDGAVQHAQVAVPVADGPSTRRQPAQGLDLYA